MHVFRINQGASNPFPGGMSTAFLVIIPLVKVVPLVLNYHAHTDSHM